MTSVATSEPGWARDEFLGQCLEREVLRLSDLAAAPAAARAAVAGGKRWMIEAKVPVDRVGALSALTDQGFHLVDTNVQLTRAARAPEAFDARCRLARADDEAAVRDIAGRSFSQSRFHFDPIIPDALADRLKAEWAGNFFSGRRGHWMVVAEDERGVGGFLQLLRGPDDLLVIDLIAVAPERRGRALARSMIACAAQSCLGRPAAMLVGTQIANFGSLALYGGMGFRVSSAAHVLHLHSQDRPT